MLKPTVVLFIFLCNITAFFVGVYKNRKKKCEKISWCLAATLTEFVCSFTNKTLILCNFEFTWKSSILNCRRQTAGKWEKQFPYFLPTFLIGCLVYGTWGWVTKLIVPWQNMSNFHLTTKKYEIVSGEVLKKRGDMALIFDTVSKDRVLMVTNLTFVATSFVDA